MKRTDVNGVTKQTLRNQTYNLGDNHINTVFNLGYEGTLTKIKQLKRQAGIHTDRSSSKQCMRLAGGLLSVLNIIDHINNVKDESKACYLIENSVETENPTYSKTTDLSVRYGLDFEHYVAKRYIEKIHSSNQRGVKFELSLISFRNLLKAKKCYYTGIPLVIGGSEIDDNNVPDNYLTLERVDPNKGYISGNVRAVSHIANQLKSVVEYKTHTVSYKQLSKMFNKLNEV